MKQSEIKGGRIYSNDKGRKRMLVDRISCPCGWIEVFCVRYRVVNGPFQGVIFTVTLKSFAAWAKGVVDGEGE
jgi:hypothetical protein